MWSLPKTRFNYVNYVVLSNWALTKGNFLYSTLKKKETHEQTKPADHTHFKRGPDFTDQGMTPTGVLQFGPSR